MGELPHIKALVERHSPEQFAVLGVNTDQDPDAFRKKCEEHGVTWDNVFNGSTSGGVPEAWGVRAYPTMYVLDPQGVIRAISPRGEQLERVVDRLVAESFAESE